MRQKIKETQKAQEPSKLFLGLGMCLLFLFCGSSCANTEGYRPERGDPLGYAIEREEGASGNAFDHIIDQYAD